MRLRNVRERAAWSAREWTGPARLRVRARLRGLGAITSCGSGAARTACGWLLEPNRDASRWTAARAPARAGSGDGARPEFYGSESTPARSSHCPAAASLFAVSPETGAMRQLKRPSRRRGQRVRLGVPTARSSTAPAPANPAGASWGFVNGAMVRGESGGAARELATPVGNPRAFRFRPRRRRGPCSRTETLRACRPELVVR
jgi:hypothetical protein